MSPISRAHSLSPPLARGRRAAPHCCRVFTLCKTALHKLEMDYIKPQSHGVFKFSVSSENLKISSPWLCASVFK